MVAIRYLVVALRPYVLTENISIGYQFSICRVSLAPCSAKRFVFD